MALIKTKKEEKLLEEGGRRLAGMLREVAAAAKPGVSTKELNDLATNLLQEGDQLAFMGYQPKGAPRKYPAGLCISINDEAVHGIPNESDRLLKEGDIISLDMGLIHQGLITDAALAFGVGQIDEKAQKLIKATEEALMTGIEEAQVGKRTGDIGGAIEEYVKSRGFVPAEGLGGHGVGYKVHEEPFVPNIGPKNRGAILKEGMVLAIEPIINEGKAEIYVAPDGYTCKTADGQRSAQFEHTILVTKKGPKILTQ